MIYSYLFKFIIIGSASVGKSAILFQFTESKFSNDYNMTIGVEYGSRNIDISKKKNIKLQIWDTAGQETFRSIARAYYRGAVGVLLVYDITSKKTFLELQSWLKDLKENNNQEMVIMLIGNKTDLENKRQVSYSEGLKFANDNDLYFMESSAKNNMDITQIFIKVTELIYENILSNKYDFNNENIGIKVGVLDDQLQIDISEETTNDYKCNC